MRPQLRQKSLYLLGVLLIFGTVTLVSGSDNYEPETGPSPIMPQDLPSELSANGPLIPWAYLPAVFTPPAPKLWVDTQNRQEVLDYYQNEYKASNGVADNWTGSHGSCNPGTTSAAFKTAMLTRINYFRGMAGVPAIEGFKAEYNQKAQAAALMMSVNRQLSHSPPSSWICYSAGGKEGAGSSNLYLGMYGPSAISGYIYDPGGGNYFVGHRRWILYPQSKFLGTGDIPAKNGYSSSNALWVFDRDNMWGPRPATREEFVAWPPPGYVPYQIVYPRWSFSYAGADFSGATVAMSRQGQPVTVQVQPVGNGYGENTLVWEPAESFTQPPVSDKPYQVTVNNVMIGGNPRSFSYTVILFDPGP